MRLLECVTVAVAVTLAATTPAAQRQILPSQLPVGLGVAQVIPRPGQTLRFFGEPGIGDRPPDLLPADVVTFRAALPSVDIAEAPPWLVPQHLKMDYEIFHLRVLTLTPDWVEVIGSMRTGETKWLARADVTFTAWPEFLLQVPSVESVDGSLNPVRARPLDSSPVLSSARAALPALAIQGDWIKVATHALADRMPPDGWMRWRRGDRLLITYNPLS